MPLIIPKTLPAYDALYEENVFVMHRERALAQHIRPLEILILNLMPTKIATETQIARLLANTPLQVHMTLLQTASHAATHVSAAHLDAFYKTFDEVKNNRYDGMIITGAPVETMDFEPYKTQVKEWFETTETKKRAAEEKPVLKVDHLNFSYQPGKPILSDVSFTVNKGEMLSIVGKNGAGKTTLSGLICRFLTPESGSIELNGEDISPLSIKERGEKIGIVMQNPNQMISKPLIFDEVALGLAVRGVPEDEIKERVHETLKICGLYPFRNWPVSALSFGQKKRVTIASILVMKPEILILDEPTAGQDYRHYTEIMEFLKRINEEQGTTIIMITHDMHLMLEYTGRALVVADGKLLSDDTPANILTDEELTEKAYLKQTSLYEMAVKCGISSPSQFVERFISYERTVR